MIESPLIQEIVAEAKAEAKHDAILRALEVRLGAVPPEVATVLRTVYDEQKLRELFDLALVCPDQNAFRVKVPSWLNRR